MAAQQHLRRYRKYNRCINKQSLLHSSSFSSLLEFPGESFDCFYFQIFSTLLSCHFAFTPDVTFRHASSRLQIAFAEFSHFFLSSTFSFLQPSFLRIDYVSSFEMPAFIDSRRFLLHFIFTASLLIRFILRLQHIFSSVSSQADFIQYQLTPT